MHRLSKFDRSVVVNLKPNSDFFLKDETIETHARPFLTLNILAIGRVSGHGLLQFEFDRSVVVNLKPISYLFGVYIT